jgi:hypothetical protein
MVVEIERNRTDPLADGVKPVPETGEWWFRSLPNGIPGYRRSFQEDILLPQIEGIEIPVLHQE